MTTFLASNNAGTTLAGSITSSATTAALSPGTGVLFPNPSAGQQFSMTFVDAATGLVNEIVYVTAMSGDTITAMIRGRENTTARSWLANDLASDFFTAGQFSAMGQIPNLQQNAYTYAPDTGAVNAYAASISPALATPLAGATIGFTCANTNTGASTFALNGGTAYAIWGSAHSPLQGGEMLATGYVELEYSPVLNSGAPIWLLLESTGGAMQVGAATQSKQAMQLGQATGRLINIQVITATGTYTPTAGALTYVIEGVGGGAAGGGCPTAASAASAGGGGSSGVWGRTARLTIAGSVAITIGTAGLGASGAVGGVGGATSFGAIATFPGGIGGGVGTALTSSGVNGGAGGVGGAATGCAIFTARGAGGYGLSFPTISAASGAGGSCLYGNGGQPSGSSVGTGSSALNGNAGSGYGAGGSGGLGVNSGVPTSGGNGLAGLIIVWEYA